MEWKVFAGLVFTAFIAELGDKSQVLAVLYSSSHNANPIVVFLGISLALVVATALGVFAGTMLGNVLSEQVLSRLAGAGFIVLGIVTLLRG